MTTAHDVICEKEKMREKDVVGIVTFDLIGLLLTNHIIAYITLFHNKSKARALIGQLATTICPWVYAKKMS